MDSTGQVPPRSSLPERRWPNARPRFPSCQRSRCSLRFPCLSSHATTDREATWAASTFFMAHSKRTRAAIVGWKARPGMSPIHRWPCSPFLAYKAVQCLLAATPRQQGTAFIPATAAAPSGGGFGAISCQGASAAEGGIAAGAGGLGGTSPETGGWAICSSSSRAVGQGDVAKSVGRPPGPESSPFYAGRPSATVLKPPTNRLPDGAPGLSRESCLSGLQRTAAQSVDHLTPEGPACRPRLENDRSV